jgi:hypothetical protein
MMPYHTYGLYQVERAKTPREIQHADGQAALLAAAISRLFRAIAQDPAAARMPYRPANAMAHPPRQHRAPAAPH